MNKENSKTNEPHKFVLNLSQKLDLRIKICSMRKQHKNRKKLK